MTKVLQSDESPTGPLTDSEISWVASAMALSASFAVPLYTVITDKLGRKIGVLAIIIPQTVSLFLTMFIAYFCHYSLENIVNDSITT